MNENVLSRSRRMWHDSDRLQCLWCMACVYFKVSVSSVLQLTSDDERESEFPYQVWKSFNVTSVLCNLQMLVLYRRVIDPRMLCRFVFYWGLSQRVKCEVTDYRRCWSLNVSVSWRRKQIYWASSTRVEVCMERHTVLKGEVLLTHSLMDR